MDYEKIHRESLMMAQRLVSEGRITIGDAKRILPDFVEESEDEKIKKELYESIRRCNPREIADKYIAWLEKQGEQKPVEWSEEDEKQLQTIQVNVDRCTGKWNCCGEVCPIAKCLPWLKSLRPRKQWKPSEEQMKVLDTACNDALGKDYHNALRYLYHVLKAL